MYKIIRYFIAALLLNGICSIPTSHAMSYTLVGGASYGNASFLPGSGLNAEGLSLAWGGGLLLGFVIIPQARIELGVLYLPRGFIFSSSESSTQVVLPSVQLPLLLRIVLMPPLSLGLGGYFSYALSSSGLQGSFSQMDWGLVASLALQIEMTKSISFIADGRYLYGIHPIHPAGAAGATGSLRDYQILFGPKFGF